MASEKSSPGLISTSRNTRSSPKRSIRSSARRPAIPWLPRLR
jgi:hypothetical protein